MVRKLNPSEEVSAIVLCAGLGTRMEELTKDLPKPCLKVCGESFLSSNLKLLKKIDIKDVYVNSHYLAEKITQEVAEFNKNNNFHAQISHEPELLEVIGTIISLRKKLKEYFFLLSSESIFEQDKLIFFLQSMLDKIVQDNLDGVFLLADRNYSFPDNQKGDFDLEPSSGNLIWGGDQKRQYIYTGISLLRRDCFDIFHPGKINFKQFLLAKKRVDGSLSDIGAIVYNGHFANLGDKDSFLKYNQFNF
jgi:MurNAc alpha-1-phosphate uridylyltransferase